MPALLKRIRWKVLPPKFPDSRQRLAGFTGKRGIEIGGPSAIFKSRGMFPVYDVAAQVDNCVFGQETVWDGKVRSGITGKHFVAEGSELKAADDNSYDFVLSSHMLEHTANPIKALKEWRRVLKKNGQLFLVLPERTHTFDRKRPVTTFEHVLDDYQSGRDESDLTHLDEILRLHDLRKDPEAGTPAEFKNRSLRNMENRCLHHHVFDERLIKQILEYSGFVLLQFEVVPPFHLAALAERSSGH